MVRGVSIRVNTYHRGNRWFWVVSDAFQNTIATGAQPFKTRMLARKAGVVARDEYVVEVNRVSAIGKRTRVSTSEQVEGGV